MIADVHKSLESLLQPIDELILLERNPRYSDIEALMASLQEFGQLKAVVVHIGENEKKTVIAGNHTVMAASRLGWTHIAAVVDDEMDEEKAIAFALVDNRVSELGGIDSDILAERIIETADYYPEILESVGWDDFEIADIVSGIEESSGDLPSGQAGGYIAPEIIPNSLPTVKPVVMDDEEDGPRLIAPEGTDVKNTVVAGVGGATSQGPNAKKAAIQYTLAFDDQEQMGKWWEFVRFLRSSSVYEGETIAERLIQFIEAHSEL